MLGRWLRRAALAGLVSLGTAGLARSQDPAWIAPPAPDGALPGRPTPGVVAPKVPRPKRFGCWASHQNFGCGSLRSECDFIFGSCRTFFGEACRKGPPPPYPPGFLQGPGQPGPGGAAPGGCNCW